MIPDLTHGEEAYVSIEGGAGASHGLGKIGAGRGVLAPESPLTSSSYINSNSVTQQHKYIGCLYYGGVWVGRFSVVRYG